MAFQDKTLTCINCGQTFVFSASDQEYHSQKGYTNEPKRCPSCRQLRRAERGYGSSATGSFGGQSRREMFTITCAECGKEAQVPFQPRGDRPVYCSEHYSQHRESTGRRV